MEHRRVAANRDQARCLVIRTKIAATVAVGVSLLLIGLAVLVADAISPGACVLWVANTALDAPSA
jgi:membrane protein implicated in regulation of membrane protease activity